MAKSSNPLGADNWLYIASHALSLYLEEGGELDIHPGPVGIVLTIPGVQLDDPRIFEGLWAMVPEPDSKED